jgi:alcohol dehydrogenase (cytochrome c)/quinohemoprotein ethanol dehydrogenase
MRNLLVNLSLAISLASLASCSKPETSASKDDKKSQSAYSLVDDIASSSNEWLTTGLNYAETRYSKLNSINLDTINDLSLAWHYDLDTNRGQEATPLFVDGVLYTTSAWSKVQAFDVKSGRLIWQYDPEVPGDWAIKGCCDVVNRGVAYADGKIYLGAFDGRLIAINALSGKEVWSKDTIIDRDKSYTITGAPRIVNGNVIIGNGGGEFGVRGYVTAYNAKSGEQAWRFYTVPGDPSNPVENKIHETTKETWTGEYWKVGGGGTVWDSMAFDPELNLLYIGVGNGSPWNPDVRSPEGGDNLFLSSIVALNPDTGEYVWHFQTTPGDQWDFTATQHMILADLDIEGTARKVLMQAPKNGFFYVLDRTNGEFISGEKFARVNWANGLDPKTGRPDIVPDAYYNKTGKPFVGEPGPMGAHSWHPMSYNEQTGLVYFAAQDLGFPYIADPDIANDTFKLREKTVNLGIDLGAIGLPDDQAIRTSVRKSLQGRLVAWDPVAQKEVWRADHGGPWNGGTLSTAGDLVFQGNRNQEFAAYNARTGEKVWSTDVQTGIVAAPMTFEMDGEQYIALVAGWGGVLPLLLGELAHTDTGKVPNRSRVLVYKIGGSDSLPPAQDFAPEIDPPRQFTTADAINSGRLTYARYCSGCHGDTAVAGGPIPDIRSTYALHDPEDWNEIILEGALSDLGMVSFKDVLSEDDAQNIRAYVIDRAIKSIAQP